MPLITYNIVTLLFLFTHSFFGRANALATTTLPSGISPLGSSLFRRWAAPPPVCLPNSSPNPAYPTEGDHSSWRYLNAMPWFKVDPTQQDHARFHAYLSMSAYGDYTTKCHSTFTKGFTVISKWYNGFAAHVPEMNKVVLVFRGESDLAQIDWTPASIEDFVMNCPGCMAAQGIKEMYLKARKQTHNFRIARNWAVAQNTKLSATGHGPGGGLAVLAGLDMAGELGYVHNQGTMRFMNSLAVIRFSNLFQALSGQSLVARDDSVVNFIPPCPYYHVGSKARITGNVTQWWVNCWGNNENSTCLGAGNNPKDHDYYFTPLGECGQADKGF